MGEKLFGNDFYSATLDSTQNKMLQTIRIPKNLLYLTDRLPKPHYDNSPKVKSSTNSLVRGRDFEENKRLNHTIDQNQDQTQPKK